MSKSSSSLLQKQRNWLTEAIWKPKSKLSLEQLKYLHYVLTKNTVVSEHNRDLLVETLRSMAEILIWGDQNDARIMDFFLEKNMLSFFLRIMRQKFGRFVCVQLLQTLNILFENMRNETSLYYLLSNNHINAIIVHKFDFSDEEVLAYYISFLKTLSLKLNKHTIHFFYNEHLSDFPLYSEAIQFFNHGESMVRIAVRTISLNVYQIGDQSVLDFICNRSAAPYFSNLVWFIGNHVLQLDECASTTASHFQRDRLESMVAEQLDLVHYLNDILCLGVDSLNHLLVTHLLDRLVIPLYVYSLEDGRLAAGPEEQPYIGKLLSLFLLAQKLLIMKHGPLATALGDFILRGEIRLPPEVPNNASGSATRGHIRYPSRGSLRAFVPPTEQIGVPIAAVSRSSSVSSVAPSPATAARQNHSQATSSTDGRSTRSSPQQVATTKGSPTSHKSSLSSFTDLSQTTPTEETVSNELIPMVSVRKSMLDGDNSGDFSVTMLAHRTTSVGKSRFFSGSDPGDSSPETAHRSVGESSPSAEVGELPAKRGLDQEAKSSLGSADAATSSLSGGDEVDGNTPGGGLVIRQDTTEETALEACADVIASPVTGVVSDGTEKSPLVSAFLAKDGGQSEADSGIFSERMETNGSPSPGQSDNGLAAAAAPSAESLSHPLQPSNNGESDNEVLFSTGGSDKTSRMLCEKKQSNDAGMSPYLKAILSTLNISEGDDRQALYSVVLFYALLRHKGVASDVFESVPMADGEVCSDIRSVMVDHVIQLIRQICHDCSTSRLITLQAALVVLQHLMKDEPRRPADSSHHVSETKCTATHGESTPADGALVSGGSITPTTSREALATFEDMEAIVPNSLPTSRDSSASLPGLVRESSSAAPGSGAGDSSRSSAASCTATAASTDSSPEEETDGASSNRQPSAAHQVVFATADGVMSASSEAPSSMSGANGSTSSSLPVLHRRISDSHVAQLRNAYQDCVKQLRLFYQGFSDDIFLDMFEDEYFNITKCERLNIEYLMNDASTLLPPTPTPLTGIPFSKRLPNGEVERARRAMQVFLLARQLIVNILGERELYLPLMATDGQLKVDDRPDLMNTDLLACNVYMDDTDKPLKRFFFIGESQMILVEPDMTQLGWGVVRYVANLEDIDVATDSGDNSLLHVTFHQPLSKRRRFVSKHPARQTINMWQFEFTDHIRCMAAKKRILQACERIKQTKQNKICSLLEVPRLRTASTPSSVGFIGVDQPSATTRSPVAPAMASASAHAVTTASLVTSPGTIPPSVPVPLEIAPLVVDTALPATAAVSRSEGEFEVISVADPSTSSDTSAK